MPVSEDLLVCRCGHPEEAHEHWREGTECAACDYCRAYRPVDRAESSKGCAVLVGLAGIPVLVMAALAAGVYLGGWATALLLGLVGAGAVWLIIRSEEDR